MADHHQFRPLAELGDYELTNEQQDIRGKSVLGPAGQSVGSIRELLVDKDHDRVAAVRMDDGAVIPIEDLERRGDTALMRDPQAKEAAPLQQGGKAEEQRIPILQEELLIGKRQIDRGGVRVQSRIVEEAVSEDVALREEHVSVARRPVVEGANPAGAAVFGERTIAMAQTAEEAVVSKEAQVVEEVIVRKDVGERVERIDETVRHTEVDVQDDRTSGGS